MDRFLQGKNTPEGVILDLDKDDEDRRKNELFGLFWEGEGGATGTTKKVKAGFISKIHENQALQSHEPRSEITAHHITCSCRHSETRWSVLFVKVASESL
jgi:hypothetical protein